MSSDDIANLYRQFGGQPENYQELGRDNVMRQSRERWPMLANVRQEAARAVRPVSADVAGAVSAQPGTGPVPTVFDEAAARAAADEARGRPPIQARARPASAASTAFEAPAAPVEPVLSAEPLAASPIASPVAAHPPVAQPLPAAASFPPVARAHPADNQLQGIFARLARAPEPPAAPADAQVSLLRRLLRP